MIHNFHDSFWCDRIIYFSVTLKYNIRYLSVTRIFDTNKISIILIGGIEYKVDIILAWNFAGEYEKLKSRLLHLG